MTTNTRQIAYDTLMRVLKDGAYSNIAIDVAIKENQLDKAHVAFTSALFYGVLENSIKLDYVISKYSKKPPSSLDLEVLLILRMGIYQLLEFDRVPDNAAVDECVKLVAYARKASAKGFVNAILRSFLRDEKKIVLPDKEQDSLLYYSVQYSCPKWLLEQWQTQYSLEDAVELAKASLNRPPLTIRVNTLKTTTEKLIGYLENHGVQSVPHVYMDNCLEITHSGSIDKLAQYKQGLFYVQDVASQLCTLAVGAKQNEIVLDICSAPGSKAFTIAQDMENTGTIYAYDLFEHKVKLITMGAKRLGISNIKAEIKDGALFDETVPLAKRVLCDVPCSGLGIIRRKAEIKYKPYATLVELPELQGKILTNAARYVEVGGTLVYSTCTTNKKENEEVVLDFLKNNNCFEPLQFGEKLGKIVDSDGFYVTLLPHKNSSDGFFIATMTRTS